MSNSQVSLCLTPAAYQVKHRHEDAAAIFAFHYPKAKVCGCGEKTPTPQVWAEHLSTVMFPVPKELP